MRIAKLALVVFWLFALTTNAQEKTNCNFNINRALLHLKGTEYFKKDRQKAINYLIPCLELKNSNAQLIMGRLLLEEENEESHRKGFKLIKEAAEQDNSIAATDLGILYKYGKGCRLNYNKARKWFVKAHQLGSDKAAYTLGYLYLKGFGNIKQNYSKAIEWFEKSDYPMAKYWLGICYSQGYGVQKNAAKANQLLTTHFENPIDNNAMVFLENKTTVIPEKKTQLENETVSVEDIKEQDLEGTWIGDLLLFDWSGNTIEQKIPLQIDFVFDTENEILKTTVTVENREQEVSFTKIENTLYFDDFNSVLPHVSYSKNIPKNLKHQILSTDLLLKNLNTEEYLTGAFETYVHKWKEKGVPMRFVLKRKETFTNSGDELTDEALKALSSQDNSFIKLYPNPFENDLIVSYTLEKPSRTKVIISNLDGLKNEIIKPSAKQSAGTYRYFFEGTSLSKGMYIVTVLVDNQRKTRIVLKK